ncbi:hypothetical protein COW36_16145 [bacterium (Candidatus Blackallbacteria) CG17_big_fil_post_rev_8_21_14_2_50_48_46]|uniref:Uncharacterized protein n=1 Tax=bacterium (Candidatus Blackallbacteria) CG17_big_fil_post_rev_8_21_14_2_50_48_46 TaxID=2014261 RepID=A0A2M7G2C0_9BACT|nr:MAG: hypothetical protein COW64_08520 [bacterium (Candidatus Blackallbacteria) CG18_big_fil_WC_8_21_14_2_50_49_26]PIW15734.1 MAG: hypothetical protein COW36_16145 [bacterium (Candidatus Blackallbacteria) CG17_big_fil_post_rev_8_21_14_2_50_48_46]PIW49236.1 MAG: hypothetical protein COW20_06655 [bacterium (Candidatus Blackallbacteria) CG13_big_fil_rev_8_21_14_2_50_49_14]
MSDMQIGQRIQTPQPVQKLAAPVQMPQGVVVEKKSAEDLQALQQKSDQSKQLGQVGTRAQIDHLKARVEQMDMQGVEPLPELSTLDTVQKYGGMLLSGTGTVLAAPFKMAKSHFTSGFVEASENREMGSNLTDTGKLQGIRSESLGKSVEALGSLREKLSSLLQADEPNWGEVDKTLKEVGTHLEAAGLPTESVNAARQTLWGDPSKSREVLNTINVAQPIMRVLAESAKKKSETLQELGGEYTSEGNRTIVQNTATILQATTPVVSAVNFIAQGVDAAKNAKSFMASLADGGGKVLQGGALTGVMVGGGALQIVGEGIDMYKNASRLNTALNRVEMARGLLADAPGRNQMATEFENKAKELENPQTTLGKISLFFSRKSSRLEKVAELKAKAAAIRSLPAGEPSKEAKAVAQQIIKRADMGFKALKIAKNVLGIAAGAVAIAVAVGALATPVGWALAGAALAATVGLAIYSKVKSSQRQGKIDDLKGVQQQASLKMETKQTQLDTLKGQIQKTQGHIQAQIREQNQLLQPYSPADQLKFNSLDASIKTSKETLKTLTESSEKLEQEINELKGIQTEAVFQLLGASPEDAAKLIYKGVLAGKPEMRYLAEKVLNVPSPELMPEKEAVQVMMRGMSLNPTL